MESQSNFKDAIPSSSTQNEHPQEFYKKNPDLESKTFEFDYGT